jgi:hypothetical protein
MMGKSAVVSIGKFIASSVLEIAIIAAYPSCVVAQEITIKIEFDQFFDRITPTQKLTQTHYNMEIHISQSGNINHIEHKYNWSGEIFTFSKQFRIGGNSKVEWRVVDKNSLINVFEYKSFRRGILVTVKDGACSAKVDFELKPGYSDYQYRSEPSRLPAVARSVRAEHLICSINGTQPASLRLTPVAANVFTSSAKWRERRALTAAYPGVFETRSPLGPPSAV